MLKQQAGTLVELPHPANGQYLEHQYCQIVREVFESIHTSGLDKFTYAFIDSCWNDLKAVIYDLECRPENVFQELIEVIDRLQEARNELRLGRFLFDVEEIQPVYCLIMRNKAVLRAEKILHRVLRVWPLYNSAHE